MGWISEKTKSGVILGASGDASLTFEGYFWIFRGVRCTFKGVMSIPLKYSLNNFNAESSVPIYLNWTVVFGYVPGIKTEISFW